MPDMIEAASIVRIQYYPSMEEFFGAVIAACDWSIRNIARVEVGAKPRYCSSPSSGRVAEPTGPVFGRPDDKLREVGWGLQRKIKEPHPAPKSAPPSRKTGRDKALSYPVAPSGVGTAQVGDDGLAGGRGLSFRGERTHAFRQIDVDPRAEPDHADALAGADAGALLDERHDAARHQAGDLDDADAGARGRRDKEAVALVVLARLVEIRVDEGARPVRHPLDAAGDRAAVHVAVEHAHEDRDARHRLVAERKLGRWHRVDDAAHPPV